MFSDNNIIKEKIPKFLQNAKYISKEPMSQ